MLPRNIASFKAFENAMTLDIAMGGSTNTVLHMLAAAHEADVEFTMADIDRLSRRVPVLCKVAPVSARRSYGRRPSRRRHHGDSRRTRPRRADQARLPTVHSADAWRGAWRNGTSSARPAIRCSSSSSRRAGRRSDADRIQPVPPLGRARPRPRDGRDPRRPSSLSPRMAVSRCCMAISPLDGCIVKTAGVDASILKFAGPAVVFESQDAAVERHSRRARSKAGDVVVIRYEGPRGGPGMQEMLYPTSYLKSKGLGKACALITDGRFSGGTSGFRSAMSRRRRRRAA